MVEAAFVVSMTIPLSRVPDDDEEAEAMARKRAVSGRVRQEWDLVTLSAARALSRHLARTGRVTRLQVLRTFAGTGVELLVNEGSDDTTG